MKSSYNVLHNGAHLFAMLGVLLIPFPFYLLHFHERIAPYFFSSAVSRVSATLLGTPLEKPVFNSDTPGLYALFIVLAVIALLSAFVIEFRPKLRMRSEALINICRVICAYYLSLQLLKFGFDKVFKTQFYLPEPNILYSTLGQLDKATLFWSTMGTSWWYNVFMGLIEVVPGVFLLFKRTRVSGLIISSGVMLNVVMIDYGFGIDVMSFAAFLLYLSLLLLLPFMRPFYALILQGKTAALPQKNWDLPFEIPRHFKIALKTFVVGIIFLEALYPYLKHRNFNDDLAPRPALHGVYDILSMTGVNGDTLSQPLPLKRFFIHRQGFIIFQDTHDAMQDYALSVDSAKKVLILTDYALKTSELSYQLQDSLFTLRYPYQGQACRVVAKQVNWRNLPLLR